MTTMTERNDRIVEAYQDGQTLREIGDEFDLSYERIRQILEKRDIDRRSRGTDLQTTRNDIIEAIQEAASKRGGFDTTVLMSSGYPFSQQSLYNHFDSLSEAVYQANVDLLTPDRDPYIGTPNGRDPIWPTDEILTRLKREMERQGRYLKFHEWNGLRSDDDPTAQTIQKRFGTWRAALNRARKLGGSENGRPTKDD